MDEIIGLKVCRRVQENKIFQEYQDAWNNFNNVEPDSDYIDIAIYELKAAELKLSKFIREKQLLAS